MRHFRRSHGAQHLSFFGTAILFWWSILDRRASYGAAALYVFLSSLHSGLLGVLLFLSPRLWYASYGNRPDGIADQQLAGILMWVPGGVVFALAAVLLIWRWMTDMDRRAAARDRLAMRRGQIPRLLALLGFCALGCAALAACNDARPTAVALTGGDPDRGKEAIRKYGCWTCHTIPGIAGANAVVGPPLDKIASRSYVAGQANSVAHMIDWIREPQKIRQRSPMPNMGVTEREARDIAAYLYTLR